MYSKFHLLFDHSLTAGLSPAICLMIFDKIWDIFYIFFDYYMMLVLVLVLVLMLALVLVLLLMALVLLIQLGNFQDSRAQ